MNGGVAVIERACQGRASRGGPTRHLDLMLDARHRLRLIVEIGEAHPINATAILSSTDRSDMDGDFLAIAWTGGAREPVHLHVNADRGNKHLTLWVGSAGFTLPRSEADKVEVFLLDIGAAIPVCVS